MRSNRVIILLSASVFLIQARSYSFQDNDFQYWNTEGVSWKIADDWKMELEEEFRFGNDVGDFYYQHTDIGITYSGLAEWLDIGINERLIFEEKSNGWQYTNTPHANAALKFDLYDLNLSTRSRFEFRDKENADAQWRYRNKFTLKLPKFTEFEVQPYIADEIFYNFEIDELNRNRLYGGVSAKLFGNLKGEIYYLWQSSESDDDWTDYHILGTKLKVSF